MLVGVHDFDITILYGYWAKGGFPSALDSGLACVRVRDGALSAGYEGTLVRWYMGTRGLDTSLRRPVVCNLSRSVYPYRAHIIPVLDLAPLLSRFCIPGTSGIHAVQGVHGVHDHSWSGYG